MTNSTAIESESTSTANGQVSFKTARKSLLDGDYELAIEQFKKLLNAGKGDRALVLSGLGLAYFDFAAFDDARNCFEQVLEIDAKPLVHVEARVNLGSCLLELGDYEAAESRFYAGLNTTSDGGARYNLACLRSRQRRYDEALDWLEQALEIRPYMKAQAREDEDFKPLRPYVRFTKCTEESDEYSRFEVILFSTILALLMPFFVIISVSRLLWAHINARWMLDGWFYRRLIHWRNKGSELHGIRVGKTLACFKEFDTKVYDQIDQALELIRRCSPRRYQRVCADLDWILVGELPTRGAFQDASQACLLDLDFLTSKNDTELSSLHKLASTIVHEACHARLALLGLPYHKCIHRHEILCGKQQQRFLEEAKSDEQFPVPASFDTDYECHYGHYQQWCYEEGSCLNQICDVIKYELSRFQQIETAVTDDYREHVWSHVDNFVKRVNELQTSPNENSQCAIAWFANGRKFALVRQYTAAIHSLTKATRLQPSLPNTWWWLGRTAYHHGDIDLAYQSFHSALADDPKDQSVLRWLAALGIRSEDNKAAALEYAERLVAEYPDDHALFLTLARAEFANGQLDAALKTMKKTLEYHPQCNRGRLLAMTICQSLGQDEAATKHWQRYLQDRRDERDKLAKPAKVLGIVMRCDEGGADEERPELYVRCLLSMRSGGGDRNFLLTLAQRLCTATEKPPTSIADEYLYSMVRRNSIDGTLFALPKSVAGRSQCYLADIRIPRQAFIDSPSPSELDVLPIWIDRANLGHMLADKTIAGS